MISRQCFLCICTQHIYVSPSLMYRHKANNLNNGSMGFYYSSTENSCCSHADFKSSMFPLFLLSPLPQHWHGIKPLDFQLPSFHLHATPGAHVSKGLDTLSSLPTCLDDKAHHWLWTKPGLNLGSTPCKTLASECQAAKPFSHFTSDLSSMPVSSFIFSPKCFSTHQQASCTNVLSTPKWMDLLHEMLCSSSDS